MSTGIPESTSYFQTVKNYASSAFAAIASAASWAGRSIVSAGSAAGGFISDCASKVAEWVKPFFKQMSAVADKHPGLLVGATVVVAAAGAAIYMLINYMFSKAKGTEQVAATAPAAAVDAAAVAPAPVLVAAAG